MILKGQNFRVKLGGKYVAASNSCTLHVAANLEDTSTKDSTGDWSEQEVTGKSWDGSVDALVVIDSSDTDAITGIDATDLIGETVDIEYTQTTGEKNRADAASGIKRYGKAIVNDVSQTFSNKQNSTYSMQFQGVGALSKTPLD